MPRNSELKALRDDTLAPDVSEINLLDGFTGTATDLNRLAGMTAGQVAVSTFMPVLKPVRATVTADTTVVATDCNTVIVADSTSANVTLTFSASASVPFPVGSIIVVVNVGSANNVILSSLTETGANQNWHGIGDNGTTVLGGSVYIRPGGAVICMKMGTSSDRWSLIGSGFFSAAS